MEERFTRFDSLRSYPESLTRVKYLWQAFKHQAEQDPFSDAAEGPRACHCAPLRKTVTTSWFPALRSVQNDAEASNPPHSLNGVCDKRTTAWTYLPWLCLLLRKKEWVLGQLDQASPWRFPLSKHPQGVQQRLESVRQVNTGELLTETQMPRRPRHLGRFLAKIHDYEPSLQLFQIFQAHSNACFSGLH